MPGELERAETAAFRDLASSVPDALARRYGFGFAEIDGACCGIARGLAGLRELNRVMGLGLGGACTLATLDEIAAFYMGASYVVALSPEARPGEVAAWLAGRGFRSDYAWMKFVCTPDPELRAPTDLRLEKVGADRADDFAQVVVEAYGMPPWMHELMATVPARSGWSCWVAYGGERPCGAGAMYVDGDSAWLGFGGTVPEARGRGAQSALLAARLREAAEAGCRTATTETGVREPGRPVASYRNIMRAGFEEVYERPNWRSPEALEAA
jgi:GNAT superfamily N-acetyltransferase